MSDIIGESAQYDNYLDPKNRESDVYNTSLERFLDEKVATIDPDKKKQAEDKPSEDYKRLYVNLKTLDDYYDFCVALNQMIDFSMKEVYYPFVDDRSSLNDFLPMDTKVVIDKNLLMKRKNTRPAADPEEKYWKKHWLNMPSFIQNHNLPYKSLIVKFREKKHYETFGSILGLDLTEKTKSVYYPKPNRKPNSVYRWMQAEPRTNPNHPVYIISKSRYDSMFTSRSLARIGVPHYIVIEPQEEHLYENALDVFGIRKFVTLLVAPFSNHGDGPGRARNWAWDHAISIGATSHWVLDDNIQDFYRLHQNQRIRVDTGVFFRVMEDFCDRYDNVFIAGPQYRFFIAPDSSVSPFSINTRIYSCLLIRNDCKHRWRGRYNEDTDICLRVLKDGDCTIQFNAFLQGKCATQTVKGGNTSEFYHKEFVEQEKEDMSYNPKGTINKSQMLVDMHPDVTSLVWRYGRWHHHVDYSGFKDNRPILKSGIKIPSEPNEYGMYLIDNYTADVFDDG
jgi:hypothetical protein